MENNLSVHKNNEQYKQGILKYVFNQCSLITVKTARIRTDNRRQKT